VSRVKFHANEVYKSDGVSGVPGLRGKSFLPSPAGQNTRFAETGRVLCELLLCF
jgi:hypothetical protein